MRRSSRGRHQVEARGYGCGGVRLAVILLAMLLVGGLLTHPWAASVDPWDNGVVRWFADHRTSGLNRVAAACTFLGDIRVGVVLAAVVAVVVSGWQRFLRPALFLTVLVAGVLGLYLSGTHLIPRDRPPVRILDVGLEPDHSFPSGHVATAVVVYGGAALLVRAASPRCAGGPGCCRCSRSPSLSRGCTRAPPPDWTCSRASSSPQHGWPWWRGWSCGGPPSGLHGLLVVPRGSRHARVLAARPPTLVNPPVHEHHDHHDPLRRAVRPRHHRRAGQTGSCSEALSAIARTRARRHDVGPGPAGRAS